jgi:predicted lactoylglutathione lyase
MTIQTIWVNLPIKNIQQTRDFWTKQGFSFNEQFSDEKALCLILKEDSIYAMLITHDFFSTFTNRPIADGTTTQVLNAIQVDSVDTVNKIVSTALANGGTRYKESQDHEWMYYDTFADIDGHQWEIMYADYSKIPS